MYSYPNPNRFFTNYFSSAVKSDKQYCIFRLDPKSACRRPEKTMNLGATRMGSDRSS